MARVPISEFRAKSLLLGDEYKGIQVRLDHLTSDIRSLRSLPRRQAGGPYVVKVDQGVKKRAKQGLIELNVVAGKVESALKRLSKKGYVQFLVEPMSDHQPSDEHYLSIERVREGFRVLHSEHGGVEIEENRDAIETLDVRRKTLGKDLASSVSRLASVPEQFLRHIIATMNALHASFVEINPLVVRDDKVRLLDCAILVDSAGGFFADEWDESDVVEPTSKTNQERTIAELNRNSPSSFTLRVLNPNGSIFLLMSGGGASITIADEAAQLGVADQIANYGEYSGGPTSEETELYTEQVLCLLLTSTAKKKVLIIAGGVANFTDVAKTFTGVIAALDRHKGELRKQGVKVFVRRGGPNEAEGLKRMKEFLRSAGLFGSVAGSEALLVQPVAQAIQELKR